MVDLMRMRSQTVSFGAGSNLSVKLEIAAAAEAEEDHGHLSKRSRLSPSTSSLPLFIQWSTGNNEFPATPSQYNPLDEPSPLGLRLRKSPSLLDLIQMRLSQNKASPVAAVPGGNISMEDKKDGKGMATSIANDKLKASNFAASFLRIGCWEFVSRHEGDLVAKCYFAKHKLVWEVLKGGLKSKLEIQWSDIMALKASCPDNGPGSLTVVLARQPLFFRETNPQPRKHTLWQAASDFTDGQASIHRKHFLQCPPGLLNKHFEKLIQCDTRLNMLSLQPEIVMDTPYFDKQASALENPDEFSQLRTDEVSPVSCFSDVASPSISEFSSLNFDPWDTAAASSSKEAPSPSSVMDANAIEGNGTCEKSDSQGLKDSEQLKVPVLRPSMSMTDLVSHIGHHISEQVTSGSIPSEKASEYHNILESIAQVLLSDTQNVAASDEKLMKKVNSLCCLLQDPAVASSTLIEGELLEGPFSGRHAELNYPCDFMHEMKARDDVVSFVDPKDMLGPKQTPSIPRRDSLGDLLLHLPRIASFPKFLFDIAEADENKGKLDDGL